MSTRLIIKHSSRIGLGAVGKPHRLAGLPGQGRGLAGFTVIEMMTVILVIGILTALMIKPISGAFAATSRRAAAREVAAYMFRARTVAVQQSRASELVRSGNTLLIRVDSSGTKVQLGITRDLGQVYGATLSVISTPADTIRFDPRGFALNASPTQKIIVKRNGSDTLCVTGLGRIGTRSCP